MDGKPMQENTNSDTTRVIQALMEKLSMLYDEHIHSLSRTDPPEDLERQRMERKTLFTTLMENINEIDMTEFGQDILLLMEKHRRLLAQARYQKEILQQNMQKLQTGKKALSKYGGSGFQSNIPKVMSIKN
jgi:hypothetical protein